jgi:hypothetical protein
MIVKSIFGSHLYGTNISTSDKDYKFIFMPKARDLILQKAQRVIQQNSKVGDSAKNTSDDVDCEGFSLQQWFHFLVQGQTLATEMLFIPENFLVEKSAVWNEIQANKNRLISKKISPFLGYCRAQASKYSVKAERMVAVEQVRGYFADILLCFSSHDKLHEFKPSLAKLKERINSPYIELDDQFFTVCGRKVPLTASIKLAYDLYDKIYQEYGHRVRSAADTKQIDWKSFYHAVRIAYEANELITEGVITLPRPEKALLLQIRNAELSYAEVSDIIEQKNIDLTNNLEKSTLSDEPDHKWIEDFIYDKYSDTILKEIEKRADCL